MGLKDPDRLEGECWRCHEPLTRREIVDGKCKQCGAEVTVDAHANEAGEAVPMHEDG